MVYDYNIAKLIASEKRCGFWRTNDSCFFNKMECLRYATKIRAPKVFFHFHDEIYSLYNWKIEPTETLDQLYKERAQQLREKHPYLILMISGGADSTNMLQIFLKNNIKVDEIISVFPLQAIDKLKHTFNPNDKNPQNYMFEYTHAALPLIQSVAKHHPDIKITVLDYIDSTLNMIENNDFYKLARSGGLISVATGFFHTALDYAKSLDKKSTIVYAVDKPRISYDPISETWYSRFLDFNASYGEFDHDVFAGAQPTTEYFYYTPDSPKIVIKQSVLIKRFLESISLVNNPDSQLYKELVSERLFRGRPNSYLDINVHSDVIKKILYKDWNTEIFQAKKVTNVFHNEIGSWFYNSDLVSQRIRDYHKGQLYELLDGIHPDYFDYMGENEPAKLKFYSTKFYEL